MVARAGHGAHPGHPQTVLEGSRTYGLRLVAMRCASLSWATTTCERSTRATRLRADIYLLEADPLQDWSKTTCRAVKLSAVLVVVDTVGAGDIFGAALLAALVERDALKPGAMRSLDDSLLEEAVEYAVTAAAITCSRSGAVPPSRAETAWMRESEQV
jgi:sugar/nucleoside kinase (ribokinase family)